MPAARIRPSRRGVTLLEMLVVVGLLVLVMAILVEIFRSATGALQAQRVYTQLDQDLRRVSGMLHQDLAGTTARMTPPLNPADGLGYFTYGENALADVQGEDTDDYLAFTAKAPEGRPFTGSIVLPVQNGVAGAFQRVQITSDFAEIIYFLRNGNLYRRVFLILPSDRQDILTLGRDQTGAINGVPLGPGRGYYFTNPPSAGGPPYLGNAGLGLYDVPMSWLGLNDVSARPAGPGSNPTPILNTLGDLTNRENRAFNPRFVRDYDGDGLPDDSNGDGLADWQPTLYPGVLATGLLYFPGMVPTNLNLGPTGLNPNTAAFPYIYPNAYSRPDPGTAAVGWIHSPDPSKDSSNAALANYPRVYNHAPLDLGDPLLPPGAPQSWWGFPTKRETMSILWTDPVWRLTDNNPPLQSLGLQSATLNAAAALPALTDANLGFKRGQPYNDGLGSTSFLTGPSAAVFQAIAEEDLILTDVRSFDVKGLDPILATYVDLGYENSYAGTTFASLYGLGHEGRMPPLTADNRADPQWPALNPNIGDNANGVNRLRRVWDTWSTAYTQVPYQTIDPSVRPPFPPNRPAYPSYPPPYAVPLQGVQIQIRVTDPAEQRIKLLTIRQDFSSKL